jgi:hypothetical protein
MREVGWLGESRAKQANLNSKRVEVDLATLLLTTWDSKGENPA